MTKRQPKKSIRQQPRRTRRRSAGKLPRNPVLVVCDGEKTEPDYCQKLQLFLHVPIEVVRGNREGAPDAIVKRAIKIRNDRLKSDGLEFDTVWCVYDSDSRTVQQLQSAKTLANNEGIQIALTVPCFEFWFLLHFVYTTSPYRTCGSVVNALKKKIKNYDKGNPSLDGLMERVEDALMNAKKLRADSVKSGRSNPSTDVDLLVEKLKSLTR